MTVLRLTKFNPVTQKGAGRILKKINMTERASKIVDRLACEYFAWCRKGELPERFRVSTPINIDWQKLGVWSYGLGNKVEVAWIADAVISASSGTVEEISLILNDYHPQEPVPAGYRFTFNRSQLNSNHIDIPESEVKKDRSTQENNQPASIDSFVHDQGGGWSWCSSCNTKLDLDKIRLTMRCPNPQCNRPLVWGKTDYNLGGSDF